MKVALNTVHQGDCIEWLAKLQPGTVDLAFADPPFNIGYDYDVYDDRRAADDYLSWSKQWIAGVHRALKPDGTFWLAIGDEFAAELKLIAQKDVGFHCRSWVIWYYTFGVNCKNKFTRSHAHLFHFVKDPKKFTFNADDPAIRVPSARQLVYADARANPKGRLPDDTWILRPQDLPEGFRADGDVWFFSRVAGTFKERAGFHGCQMPERLLARIINVCSRPNDVALDPFAGSGSTLVTAKKLDRRYLGFELSAEYASRVRERLDETIVGSELVGPADPLRSAPSTSKGKQRNILPASISYQATPSHSEATLAGKSIAASSLELRERGIVDAFRQASRGYSADRLVADPELDADFIRHCYRLGLPGDPATWNRQLFRMRKSSLLHGMTSAKAPRWTSKEMDLFSFASEIAWHELYKRGGWSLDDILCDPALANQFDDYARSLAPGFASFQYRWAALQIRKRSHSAQAGASKLKLTTPPKAKLSDIRFSSCDGQKGVYSLRPSEGNAIYVGETRDLGRQLRHLRMLIDNGTWQEFDPTFVRVCIRPTSLIKAQGCFIRKEKPELNMLLSARKTA